jgi:hypothetical protein
MPTIGKIGSLRVVVWPNDHRPAHVHVIGPEGEAVFNLNCPDGPPELRESYGLRIADVSRIADALERQLADLCRAWSDIHGRY